MSSEGVGVEERKGIPVAAESRVEAFWFLSRLDFFLPRHAQPFKISCKFVIHQPDKVSQRLGRFEFLATAVSCGGMCIPERSSVYNSELDQCTDRAPQFLLISLS